MGSLPWTNCRIVLAEEADDDDYVPGVVARLYHTPNSHPAVRQSLQGLEPRKLSVPAVAIQHLVNCRGPDGLIGVIPGESKHSAKLLDLCQRCHDHGEVLVCTIPAADIVLVPRLPSTAARDGLYFLAFASNIRAVELCEALRAEQKVSLVLDLDNTLVDATACTISQNDWDLLDWQPLTVHTSSGRAIEAQHAPLPGHDPYSPDVHVMHWRVGRINCTFRVRVRPGWADLRAFLAQQRDKYTVFVCSKGKSEYIQILWDILDPLGQLIPRSDWPARLTSTFPDTLTRAAPKTALTALGCLSITQPQVPTQLAAPVMCLDDSPEAYAPEHEANIMYLAEYRPSDLLYADSGNVLRQATRRLQAYWTATCTSAGTFAWQAAQSFAMALMGAMQRNPMESPDALVYLQLRCKKQGEALAHQFTVRSVFGPGGTMIQDAPECDPGRLLPPPVLTGGGGSAGEDEGMSSGGASPTAVHGCRGIGELPPPSPGSDAGRSTDSIALLGSTPDTGGPAPLSMEASGSSDLAALVEAV